MPTNLRQGGYVAKLVRLSQRHVPPKMQIANRKALPKGGPLAVQIC